MKLPTVKEANEAVNDGLATPLDVFVSEWTPTNHEDYFRNDLQKLVNYFLKARVRNERTT
jgi:hypothetical protein